MVNSRFATLTLSLSMLLGTVGLVPGLMSSASAEAQSPRKSRQFGGFFAPQGKSAPQDTEGGASRGRCLQDVSQEQQAVQLVTPQNNLGLTASARPVFMAHVEESAADQIFFSLKNEDESYFYEMSMTMPERSSGIIQFQLPDNAPKLETGEQYLWSVALICGSKLGPNSPWASGWIERVEPTAELATTLSSNTLQPVERASRYGREGLWFDTAEVLANWKTRQGEPEASAAWQEFLASQNLGQFSSAPIMMTR